MRKALWMLVALVLTAGCGDDDRGSEGGAAAVDSGGSGSQAGWPSVAARTLADGTHPTPYTAQQIQAGCPDGRAATFEVTIAGTTTTQVWAFSQGDDTGCTMTNTRFDVDGQPLGTSKGRELTWAELQGHASWPAADTTVHEEKITVGAGTFDCMLYTVTSTRERPAAKGSKDKPTTSTTISKYWFALELPGPPVRTAQTIDGTPHSSMVMLKNEVK